MRPTILAVGLLLSARCVLAQAPGRWPPDSLVNTQVIPRSTPVSQVVGMMRNITAGLGVRCQYCHLGEEGMPLAQFDFASDRKQTKRVARQMLRLVNEVNARLDTLPGRAADGLQVTCMTCHRGVPRPAPLETLLQEAVMAGGSDSAIGLYWALRQRHFGGGAYDFREATLNIAAFRTARAGRVSEALALLDLNESLFARPSSSAVFRGNVLLMRGDTSGAAEAFREAVRRDSTNAEARGRLRDIRRGP